METIQDINNVIFFSQISLIEIAIKQNVGKLPDFAVTVEQVYQQALADGFTFLPIQNQYLYNYQKIPLNPIHRDPFDRPLVATALTENATVFSADKKLNLYDEVVEVRW